jgi:hypothetical protein
MDSYLTRLSVGCTFHQKRIPAVIAISLRIGIACRYLKNFHNEQASKCSYPFHVGLVIVENIFHLMRLSVENGFLEESVATGKAIKCAYPNDKDSFKNQFQ